LTLFLPNIPANNLQGVLDYGNTATQNINLTGTITTTTLDATYSSLTNSYLTEQVHIQGAVYDSAGQVGFLGQVLSATNEGVEWVTLPPIFVPNLQQVLAVGNTAENDIILDGNITANTITVNEVISDGDMAVNGPLLDSTGSSGTNGQILSSLTTGVEWQDIPVYTAQSPLLLDSVTKVFSIQLANNTQNGYLSSTDWITFSGKQNAITLTTNGSNGAATFISNTLNVPNYSLSGLGGVPLGRTLTINGATYDLSDNRTWSVGTVLDVTTSAPLSSSGGTTPNISISQSSATTNGYLSSTDWVTFNNKQAAGNYITSLTGEASGNGPGAASVTLNNSAVIGKVLTGLNTTGGTVVSTDSILTAFGKLQNQINGLIGGSIYKGTWNASTNTPTIQSGIGQVGWYYIVNVAGTTDIDGISDWNIGDWIIFDGDNWQQVDNTDAVVSVNGFTGAVNLVTTNIPEGTNLYYTDSRARLSLSSAPGSGSYNNITGVITIPTDNNQISNGAGYITLGSLSAVTPLSYNPTIGEIAIQQSGSASSGYLSSNDWTIFNSKQNAITGTGIVLSDNGVITYILNDSANWSYAYYNTIVSADVTGTTTKTLTLNKQNGGTITASWIDDNTNLVTSVFGRIGDVTAQSGDYSTTLVTEGTNLYYLDSRARAAISSSATGLTYTSSTGDFSFATGYSIPTDANQSNWTTAYDNSIVSASVTGTSTKTLTLNQQDGGTITANWSDADTGLTSVGLSMPSAFTVSNSPLTSNGTINVVGAGTASEYVRGDGTLAPFPNPGGAGGGGGAIYYFNGNTSQGTISGTTMYELSTAAQDGAAANFTGNTTGPIASFITDAGSPNQLTIPAGIWVIEAYLSESGGGSNHAQVQAVVETWNGTTLTSIATGPYEEITNGSAIDLYQFAVSIPTGITLATTDRIVIQIQIANANGKTVTLYTEGSRISSVATTFPIGISALNGLTANTQYFQTGTSGTDFNISSVDDTHTFNLPTADSATRGALSSADWTTFNNKQNALTTGNLTSGSGAVVQITNGTSAVIGSGTTISIQQSSGTQNGYLSSADWTTFNNKQTAISLTTTGSSGPSTFVGNTLNIPNYTLSGLGGVPDSRTLSINGTQYDLTQNRTWTVGTVTSVAALTLGTTGTDLSSSVATGTTTPVITLNVPTASSTNRGALSSADWSTFNNKVGTVTASSPLASSGGTSPNITIQTASASQNGALSSTDWNTFNNKQAAGNYITSLTGEATAAGPGAAAVTLNNASVTGKVLTGVSISGGSISASDTMLTAFGKLQNQINALVGSSIYQGTWNAATNTPTLTSSVGTRGYYYIVSVAGTTNLNGITDWFVGDWVIFDGTAWQQVDNTDAVSSVNGQTGAVNLTTDNISEGTSNLYFLNSRARAAVSFTAGSGAYNSTTGVFTIPTNTNQLTNGASFITLGSLSGTAPISYNSGTGAISITQSTTSTNGYLSSTDWNTFNNKQNALSGTGIVKSVGGTISYLTDNSSNWNTAYNDTIVSAAFSGTTTKTLTLTQQDGGTVTASFTDANSGGTVTSVSGTGGYGGLTLSGTVTTSGSLTLGGTPSGTWPINVSGSAGSASSASTASLVNGTSGGAITSWDLRTISPSSMTAYRMGFGFTSWANNNTAPYADYLHLRSYSDGSGGADNLITFLKSGIGMRIWQQSFGSTSPYSSYVDVITSGNIASQNVNNASTANYATSAGNASTASVAYSVGSGVAGYGLQYVSGGQLQAKLKYPLQFEYQSGDYGYIGLDQSGLTVGYANNAGYAYNVAINYSNTSYSDYQVLWGSGNSIYGSPYVTMNPNTGSMKANAFFANTQYSAEETQIIMITNNNPMATGQAGLYGQSYYTSGGYYQNTQYWTTPTSLNFQQENPYGTYSAGYGYSNIYLSQGGNSGGSSGITYSSIYSFGSYGNYQMNWNYFSVYSQSYGLGINWSAYNSGNLYVAGTVYQNQGSDAKLKENVIAIPNALDKVRAIRGVEFDWNEYAKECVSKEGRDVGVIAQEVQAVYPLAVRLHSKEEDEKVNSYLVVDYDKLNPLALQAINELASIVDELKLEIQTLKSQINGSSI
jgi:predicted heme/steroid binding protein